MPLEDEMLIRQNHPLRFAKHVDLWESRIVVSRASPHPISYRCSAYNILWSHSSKSGSHIYSRSDNNNNSSYSSTNNHNGKSDNRIINGFSSCNVCPDDSISTHDNSSTSNTINSTYYISCNNVTSANHSCSYSVVIYGYNHFDHGRTSCSTRTTSNLSSRQFQKEGEDGHL